MRNDVVAFNADGRELGIVFSTASPFNTPREKEALVAWTRKAIDEESLHPLLIIAVFIVKFLSIHPFQDGNGRLSRVLTTLLLLRAGYIYVPYASLERVVEENKELYYRALRRTQTPLNGDVPDWEPWVGFFLRALKKQKDSLAKRFDHEREEEDANDALPELSVRILALLKLHERLTPAAIESELGVNRNTLRFACGSLSKPRGSRGAGRLGRRGTQVARR